MTSKQPISQKKLQATIHNGIKILADALKSARGPERQKLGRRQKTATTDENEADLKRLSEEVIALKTFNFSTAAEIHLYKWLLQLAELDSIAGFAQYVRKKILEVRRPQSVAASNVQARLFASAVVKTAIGDATQQLREILGSSEPIKTGKKRLRAKDYARLEDQGVKVQNHTLESENPHSQSQDDEEVASVHSRIAESNTSSSELDTELPTRNDDSEWSGAEDEDEDEDDTAITHPSRPTTSLHHPSTYLPSLSMGGYMSGSDESDTASINLDSNKNSKDPLMRKNRRGQRARQRIAELKYKDKAKHLRHEGSSSSLLLSSSRNPRDRHGSKTQKGIKRAPDRTGANNDPVVPKKRAREESGRTNANGANAGALHPSWQAAKMARQTKMTASFAGKKMTFD